MTAGMRSTSRQVFVVVAIGLMVVALGVTSAVAANPGPSYPKAFKTLDRSQRFALEEFPDVMAKDLRASKELCKEAQTETDPVSAELAWQALAQVVDTVDKPVWRSNIGALRNVFDLLDDLRATFSEEWRGKPHKINTLRLGVARTEHGDSQFLEGIRRLADAFDSWHQRDCAGAQQAINAANEQDAKAIKKVNDGMEMLESLR